MNPLSLTDIATRCGATLNSSSSEITVTRVQQDTRKILPGDLYLALRGEKFDGHSFLAEAAKAGAAAAIIERNASIQASADFPLLIVEDSLIALQQLAASWRAELTAKVVCLTGSSGKTSTKEFLAAILSTSGPVCATKGNLNNHIGLPLSILAATREDRFAVWEIGMNHPGEIAPLATLARPEVAVITNIGTAHIEFFQDRAGIATEKGQLFAALPPNGLAIFPHNDDFASLLQKTPVCRFLSVELEHGTPCAKAIQHEESGIAFQLCCNEEEHFVHLPVPGYHMVQNALLAAAAALSVGISPAAIAQGLSSAQLTGGRLQKKDIQGLTILDDTYNANPESVLAALQTLGAQSLATSSRRIAVLGKMGELGSYAETGYRRVGESVALHAQALIAVGAETHPLVTAARNAGLREIYEAANTAGAATLLRSIARPGDLVLLKGSRSAGMERIITHLLE